MIPSTRPVIGDDLSALRERLGLNVGDACWLYASSMTKWSEMTSPKKTEANPVPGAKRPVPDPTLALMVRALDANIDANPLPPSGPSAPELFDIINDVHPLARKTFVVMFGAEASSGYRWVTAGRKVGPSLNRLFLVFSTLFNEAKAKSPAHLERFLNDWNDMVIAEGRRRGIPDVFKAGRWTVRGEALAGSGRPVIGEDLDALREQLGLSTQDACWLFGMPINRWMMVAKKPGEVRKSGQKERYQPGSKDPVPNAALALLVRTLNKYPHACPLPAPVSAEEVFKTLLRIWPEMDKKRFSILFGSEASSGYRWLKRSVISAPVARIFRVFMTIVEPSLRVSRTKAAEVLKDWTNMVEMEASARGVTNIFKVGRWTEPELTTAIQKKKAEDAAERRRLRLLKKEEKAAGKRRSKKLVDPAAAETRAATKTITRATRVTA